MPGGDGKAVGRGVEAIDLEPLLGQMVAEKAPTATDVKNANRVDPADEVGADTFGDPRIAQARFRAQQRNGVVIGGIPSLAKGIVQGVIHCARGCRVHGRFQ